jgi:hypothetical protein
MVYGKGFASVVVMGGMWSLSRFTMDMILCAAFSSDLVMARRTFSTSVLPSQYMASHNVMDWQRTSLGSWLRERNVQRPLLPAYILFRAPKEVGLFPLLLEELHYQLAPPALLVCAVDCAHQCHGPLLDERLEVDIVNGGEGQVEQVAGEGRYRGEVAVEEDCVQDCCQLGQRRLHGELRTAGEGMVGV